jgi:DNA helicase IV
MKATSKRIIYAQNRTRIEEIKKIAKENFIKNLNGKILRIDALKKLAESLKPESVSDRVATVFIIDEAQDYLCKEIKLIHQILTNWTTQHGHPTLLWLLGDINQRIQPVDFEWSDLHLAQTFSLKYNYRNTANILRFASIFHQLAEKVNHEVNGALRHLPPISDPESAFEEGDKVKILIGNPQELLSRISQIMQNHRNTDTPREKPERYLLKELDEVPIVYLGDRVSQTGKYYTVEKVKGQEFDSCILVSSGNPKSVFSLTGLNEWYTAVTRPRERLLVVMTLAEIEQIGWGKLQTCCELFDNSGSLRTLIINSTRD